MPVIAVPVPGAAYEVHVERGLLARAGEKIAGHVRGRTACVVTDTNVAALYLGPVVSSLESAGFAVATHRLPPGEGSKSQHHLFALYERFLAAGITRADVVVALGGGVPGDLTGFAAATWMRGVAWVQVPTTLLAMVDAAVGGKTAIDLPQGKNLIGAFHQPALVLADPDTLSTLPPRVQADGMAEVVKHGAIADAELFAWCAAGGPRGQDTARDLAWAVARNIAIKAGVVTRDPREAGERMLLNFGHTVGHAIEKVTAYRTYTHGEAVAIGMIVAARAGVRLGVTPSDAAAALPPVLAQLGLPVHAPQLDGDAVATAILSDKKNLSGQIHWVLLQAIGRATVVPLSATESIRLVREAWHAH